MKEQSPETGTNWFYKMICEVWRRLELSHPDGWGLWVGSTDQNVSSLVIVWPKSDPGTVAYNTPVSSVGISLPVEIG